MSLRRSIKDEHLEEMLRKLKLTDIRKNYQDAIEEAIEAKEGYREFLIRLATMEIDGRKKRRGDRMVVQAGFDYIKKIGRAHV